MLARLHRARDRARARREDGATTVEFLISFLVITMLLIIIAQVTIVFVNALLVNHALSLASQEASVRGRLDDTARQVYLEHLPGWLRDQCNELGLGACLQSSAASDLGEVATPGNNVECTAKGQVFDVTVVYQQDLGVLKAIGVEDGPSVINMRRSLKVASQSLNRSATCP